MTATASAPARVLGPFEVEAHADVGVFEAGEWDALAADPDDVQGRHAFVRAVQEARVEGATFRHVMLRQSAAPVAVASFCVMRVRLEMLSPNGLRRSVARGRRLWPGLLRVPVLFVGLPVSFGQSNLRLGAGAERGAAVAALATLAEEEAERLGAPLVCFKEFTDAEAEALASELLSRGYFRAASLPGCALDGLPPSFEGYLAAMRAPYRRQARADLAARTAHSLEFRRVADYEAAVPLLFGLYERVMDRAPYQLERLNEAFFRALGRQFGPRCRALVVERGGRALAAAVLLHGPTVTTFLLAGLDYDAPAAWRVYPNLVLEVVAEAIRAGARRVELGQTSYALKGRLGGCPSPRHLFLRARRPWAHALFRAAAPALFPEPAAAPRRVFAR